MEVQGILETALYVKDLPASAEFYRRVFGFITLLESERLIALDVAGRSVLLLFKEGSTGKDFPTPGGVIPSHRGCGETHFAFSISADDFEKWKNAFKDKSIAIESIVEWPKGAKSIYLRDTDHNLVELITPGFWANF